MPLLRDLTWPQLRSTRPTLLVPVGSVEQHGPHLPLDTDVRIAEAVAAGMLAAEPSLVVAPAVAYGAAGEHEGFPGTVSIGHDALRLLLVEYGRSACRWAGRLLFVNGHGGNLVTVVEAVERLRYEGRDAAWVPCGTPGGDPHAGRTETSLMAAIAPATVHADRAEPGNTAPLSELLPLLRAGGTAAASANGILGDPTGASAREGRALLATIVDTCLVAMHKWEPGPGGRL
ncbi:MAG: mycofactocin biosynthesis peptidyl-dipeptidase MftE [Pseudonocardia sp.]|uniref:mycofactocin biosynthesis peptidyl-dipeptidase MftE n=1 Tax=unclassified Pseudonocardia TaxID=2619320 RepID=UPI000A7EED17|nr:MULTISPECIES: mycofactocin biosynthesis peptidyl-dipeptidase MftE [unclassified Pseudonocardia]MBN9109036.1 mycofactocin biosynthesis peptidyl-dipeptidase MftE [Pseudonocardia sp.]